VSIAEGLRNYTEVTQDDGCWATPEVFYDFKIWIEPSIACTHPWNGFANAEAAAKKADATVVVVGLDEGQEREDKDRTDLKLPGMQQEMAERVAAASKGPVILVVMAGGSVDVAFARDSDHFAGIFFIGYPGQSGGTAFAETLFGDNNPSGRLTQTFYHANYIEQWKDPNSSYFDMSMRPDPNTGNPGRGYRFYTGMPVYSFGDGLSYTSFAYTVPETLADAAGTRVLRVEVSNTGERRGRHTVLAFAQPPKMSGAPKSLKHFAGVDLAPGARQTIEFGFSPQDFLVVDDTGRRVSCFGEWKIYIGSHVVTAKVGTETGTLLV